MSKVIHRVDAPLVTCIVMRSMGDTIDDRVSHIDVRRCHIYLGTEHLLTVSILACLHLFKQGQVFLNSSVSVRAFLARLLECSSVLPDFLRCEVAHICLALLNQLDSCLVHLIEVV